MQPDQKPQFPIKLQIEYDEVEQLDEMLRNDEFTDFILGKTLIALKQSIRKNKSECVLIEVTNYNYKIKIPKTRYKNLIKSLLKYYESKEDYSTCSELIRLESRL